MRFVVPMDVTAANLTTNVVNEYADWSAGTIAQGQRRVEGESVYEVVADPNTTDQPSAGAAKTTPTWIRLGYANIWRMWRDGADSVSDAEGDIEISVPVPSAISTVGVLNAEGVEVNVKLIDSTIMNIEAPTIENIAGTKDGSNTAFTISEDGAEVLVFLQGQKLTEGVGFSRSGTAITAIGSKIPLAGQSYIAVIFTADEPTLEDLGGTKNGSNTAFTISEAGGVALIFLNGVKLKEGEGYTRSGTAITMAAAPTSGEDLEAVIFTDSVPTVQDLSGAVDGSQTLFMTTDSGVASLFLNGARLTEGDDYTRSGMDIVMSVAPPIDSEFEAVVYPEILFPGGVIYDSTQDITDIGVGDWWAYFFTEYSRNRTVIFDDIPAYFGAGVTLEVTIFATGPTDPSSVGRLVIGKGIDAGQSMAGVRSRNVPFNVKTRDEFGNLTLVQRRTIRIIDFPVWIPAGAASYVQQQAAALSATPTLFIADPNKPETIVFGVFDSFDMIVNGLSGVEGSIGVEEF